MPQIIVTADHIDREQDPVMLRERINAADFESARFAANLVERLGWAVLDATEFEEARPDPEPTRRTPEPRHRTREASRRSARDLETVSA